MSTHILIVTPCEDCGRDVCDCSIPPSFGARVECSGVDDTCRMFVTCRDCPSPPDYDQLEQYGEAHGVRHSYVDGEWMRETNRCFVANYDDLRDTVDALGLPTGRYAVEFDVEDEVYLRLKLVEPGVEVVAGVSAG